jgi:hypothetical protein
MQNILSSEHCARITTWDGDRRALQKSKKLSNWMKVLGFIGFNIAVWILFLAPLLKP